MDSLDTSCNGEELYSACYRGCDGEVKQLIGEGADVNWANKYDYPYLTCLWVACKQGYEKIVGMLLDAGADPDKANAKGETPLIIAAFSGEDDVVDILLDAGADVNAADFPDGIKSIHWATESLPMMISLIRAGADVEAKTKSGKRPLHYACWYGNVDVVNYLVDAGVDVDAVDDNDRNARWYVTKSTYGVDEATKERITAILDGARSASGADAE